MEKKFEEKKLSETKDHNGEVVKKGDIVEVINSPFLLKEDVGIIGEIIDIEYYFRHHPGSVDDRGEGWDEETINITIKSESGKVYKHARWYCKKVS